MRRRLTATIAALAAVALTFAGLAPAAEAKNPPPPKALASTTIDAHLGYMEQRTCSPSAKQGATALLKGLIATWGGSSSGISRGCSAVGTSEHKEGRALDWHMNSANAKQRSRVAQAVKWLTANNGEVAYRLGVMYIIWNQHIWSIYYQDLGWRKMAGRGSYTANHKDHVHISLSWDGAYAQTSWWTGKPITDPLNSKCGASGVRACLPKSKRTSFTWPYQHTVVPEFLPAPWSTPGIGGSPQVGRTLTAVPGTWVPADATLAYQWTADSKDIAGANAKTYVVGAKTIGKTMRVRVNATTAAGTLTKTASGMTDVLKARFTTTPKPKIVGTVATDQTVTANEGTWAAKPDTVTYAWKRNGKAVKNAIAKTYLITSADTGRKLSVTVTARLVGYYTKSVTSSSAKVALAEFSTVPVPSVAGDFVVGSTLTVDPGTWAPLPAGIAYYWYADGRKVSGAKKITFTLTATQLNKLVQVRVKPARPGYVTTYIKSLPVRIVAAG